MVNFSAGPPFAARLIQSGYHSIVLLHINQVVTVVHLQPQQRRIAPSAAAPIAHGCAAAQLQPQVLHTEVN